MPTRICRYNKKMNQMVIQRFHGK
uniref:Uncharacterized protein n=1 Tax=Nelumbo nucifera TaxID=4432 RepID=A0A822Y4D2_NELNU|nr:TPA_asm: hypothetical protein HUJ06_027554 [Nelumbo nucifera]